jgi:hypothetical protein
VAEAKVILGKIVDLVNKKVAGEADKPEYEKIKSKGVQTDISGVHTNLNGRPKVEESS